MADLGAAGLGGWPHATWTWTARSRPAGRRDWRRRRSAWGSPASRWEATRLPVTGARWPPCYLLRPALPVAERPCPASSLLPGGAGAQHGVERHHQLAHAGRERELRGLPRPAQPLVEGRDRRIGAPRRRDRGHVEAGAQGRPAPPTVRLPRILPLSRLNG